MAAILSVFQHEGAKVVVTDFKVLPVHGSFRSHKAPSAHFTVERLETKTNMFQDTHGWVVEAR